MRSLMLLSLLALSACFGGEKAEDSQSAQPDDTQVSAADDSRGDDSALDTEPICAEEGEACVAYDDGTSSCCNGRHTCFPEGCYYSQP
ncbi:MAG: hypothetical protein H6741_05445 [Alphaproteobacteria bacterium]|nr:hypothetical protein [Alphaproteobacteria bacterium]MCB9792151.1 hypothetical protein [Alphaproteobacteria bacterium]